MKQQSNIGDGRCDVTDVASIVHLQQATMLLNESALLFLQPILQINYSLYIYGVCLLGLCSKQLRGI